MTDAQLQHNVGNRLSGRRIVITGAASGIGRATAMAAMRQGARVALLDRDRAGLDAAMEMGRSIACEVDVCDPVALDEVVARVAKEFGGVDGLINAAGIMLTGPTIDMSSETWRKVIDVNLSGSFYVAKACLPWLRRAKGSTIVNIASGAGLLPNAPGLVAYAASKGGVIALTKALASDLAPDIRVNCVSPGMVDTPLAAPFRTNVGNYALKRIAQPEEIAAALLFLTGSESSYVTGATLAVDGGRTYH